MGSSQGSNICVWYHWGSSGPHLVQEEGLAHQAGVHRAHWCRAAAGGGGEAAAAVRPRGHHPLVGAARVPASGWAPSGRGDGGEAAGARARSPGQEGRADAGGKQRHAKLRAAWRVQTDTGEMLPSSLQGMAVSAVCCEFAELNTICSLPPAI